MVIQKSGFEGASCEHQSESKFFIGMPALERESWKSLHESYL